MKTDGLYEFNFQLKIDSYENYGIKFFIYYGSSLGSYRH